MPNQTEKVSTKVEKVDQDKKKNLSYIDKIKDIVATSPKRIAIFTHPSPDPDAIGSMLAMSWFFSKLCNSEASLFYSGPISHPQNKALVNLIDPGLKPIEEYDSESFDLRILVDTIPDYAGIDGRDIEFDIVIDHHKDFPNKSFKGVYVNLKAGSCCGTIFDIMKSFDLSFSDQELDKRVATAMTIGIATDTETMISEDTTQYEINVWSDLLEFRDQRVLEKVINYEIPTSWIKRIANATISAKVEEGLAVVNMGMIDDSHRDLLAVMGDQLTKWEEVSTAVVFSLIDGKKIEGCVRSLNSSISVADLCKELGGKKGGKGGGKLGKGRYSYDLGGGSLDDDDTEDMVELFINSLLQKEDARIKRIMKK